MLLTNISHDQSNLSVRWDALTKVLLSRFPGAVILKLALQIASKCSVEYFCSQNLSLEQFLDRQNGYKKSAAAKTKNKLTNQNGIVSRTRSVTDSLDFLIGKFSFGPGACFSRVLVTFGPGKLYYVCRVCIQDQSFKNFENDKWNWQLTKQNRPTCELETVSCYSKDFDFKNCRYFQKRDPRDFRFVWETGP